MQLQPGSPESSRRTCNAEVREPVAVGLGWSQTALRIPVPRLQTVIPGCSLGDVPLGVDRLWPITLIANRHPRRHREQSGLRSETRHRLLGCCGDCGRRCRLPCDGRDARVGEARRSALHAIAMSCRWQWKQAGRPLTRWIGRPPGSHALASTLEFTDELGYRRSGGNGFVEVDEIKGDPRPVIGFGSETAGGRQPPS